MGLAFSALAQTAYRCGNKYQDIPCERGEKGRVLGGTTPTPAASDPGKTAAELEAERIRSRQGSLEQAQQNRCAVLTSQFDEARSRRTDGDWSPEQRLSAMRLAEAELKLAGCPYD